MSKRANTRELTVATFNVRHGLGLDGRVDLARTAEVIRSTGAEVVALQELDRGLDRSGGTDQAAELATLTGLALSFWPTLEIPPGAYGIGLASSRPLESRFVPLPQVGSEEPRGAIVASLDGVSIVATHLSTDRWARRRQVRALAALAASLDPPVVVAGDLNSSRWGLGPLARQGFRGGRIGPTVATGPFPRQVDHVLGGPGVIVGRTRSLPGDASDHIPVVAELAFP
jgi:endonuclease/exonuclease/phosphatase family metal-dependent hydrolase